jgi:hypothetical protein
MMRSGKVIPPPSTGGDSLVVINYIQAFAFFCNEVVGKKRKRVLGKLFSAVIIFYCVVNCFFPNSPGDGSWRLWAIQFGR